MLKIASGIVISYLVGSFPTAYIFTKLIKGIDIRTCYSGNVGATNALRVLGKRLGLTVLFIDVLKGFIPVFLLAERFSAYESYRVIIGLSTVAGHIWPIFLGFKGGKGVATSLGMLIGLAGTTPIFRIPLVISFCIWLLVFVIFRYVSLASIISAFLLPIFLLIFRAPLDFCVLVSLISLFVLYKHKSNIYRLLRKEERKVNIF